MFYVIPTMMYSLSAIALTTSMTFIMYNSMFIIEWEMFSMMSMSIKMDLMLSWESLLYSSTILLISANVLKFSKNYMSSDLNKLRFTQIVLMFILSMNLLMFIPNMMSLLIGWDGLGLTSFILIMYYNNQRSLSASMLTMLMNRLGDAFMLMSITMTLNMGDWTIIEVKEENQFNTLQLLGIMTAAMTKSAQMPYSSWLPAAMAAPTPVSALVHSSTLVTAGVFLMYRFSNMIAASSMMQVTLTISGLLTMLMASMSAIHETDMKKIIALSTLSQLGLMIMCLGLCLPYLAFLHMLTHALFKALLFITAGSLISLNNHNQDLRTYGQYSKLSPITSSSMLIATMALASAPFMSGHYSKHMIMEWSNIASINLTIFTMMLMAIMMTTYYSTRLIIFMLMTTPSQQSIHKHQSSHNNDNPMTIMSVLSTTMGSTLQWLLPMTSLSAPISENLKSSLLPTYLILMTLLASLLLFTMTAKNQKPATKKLILSLMFTTPLWTQFSANTWMATSLNLYKYLDQSWLEKSIYMSMPTMSITFSSYMNLMPEGPSQQKMLMYMITSTMLTLLSYTLLL